MSRKIPFADSISIDINTNILPNINFNLQKFEYKKKHKQQLNQNK